MKKKLLVLLITLASTMMPNLASAIVLFPGEVCCGGWVGDIACWC
jgi:hypothetical protein